MFGVSLAELFVILGVLLLVLGPDKLPETARALGKFFAELRRSSDSIKREINIALNPEIEPIKSMQRELVTVKQKIKDEILETKQDLAGEIKQDLKQDSKQDPKIETQIKS